MISVVIPAFNEGPAIRETIRQVGAALTGVTHEIIVVDDGSVDATGAQAAEAGARVIRHPHNIGYGGALKTGIRSAVHDTIVITDADGTYPNADIPRLLEEFGKGFNMIVGARSGNHYHESAVKTPLRYLLKWLVEFTTGRRIPDVNSGLRVFSRTDALPYLNHLCNTFSFTTSITLAYMMTSKFVGYVPIAYYQAHRRHQGAAVQGLAAHAAIHRAGDPLLQPAEDVHPGQRAAVRDGVVLMIVAFRFDSAMVFYLGVGGMALVVTVFCLGLLAELLSQIMIKPR